MRVSSHVADSSRMKETGNSSSYATTQRIESRARSEAEKMYSALRPQNVELKLFVLDRHSSFTLGVDVGRERRGMVTDETNVPGTSTR